MNNGQLVSYSRNTINYTFDSASIQKFLHRSEDDIVDEKNKVDSNRYLSAAFLKKHFLASENLTNELGIKNNHVNADKHFTYCYLCSINAHEHEKSNPVPIEKRRYLTPYRNPVAISNKQENESNKYKLEYIFKVKTGNNKYAGTNGEVFFSLNGTTGHWPKTELKRQKPFNTDRLRFSSNSEILFKLNGPEIGDCIGLRIWHNSQSPKDGWSLDYVEISCKEIEKVWKFKYNQWISKHRPPNFSNEAYISLNNNEITQDTKTFSSYFILVKTIERRNDSQEIGVLFQAKCKKGLTPLVKLFSPHINVFRSNQLDVFYIECDTDLGVPEKIKITHDSKKIARDWLIEEIRVIYSHEQNTIFVFPFEKWFDRTNEFSGIFRNVNALSFEESHKMVYFVTTITGNIRNAGTDANVFIEIEGSLGKSSLHKLNNGKKSMFERGAQDSFNFIDHDVGEIERIRIWHDNTGTMPGWFLQTVLLKYNKTSVTGDKTKENLILKENLDKLRSKLESTSSKLLKETKKIFKSIPPRRAKSAEPRRKLIKTHVKSNGKRPSSVSESLSKRSDSLSYTDLIRQKLQPILKRSDSPRNMTRNVSFDNKNRDNKAISKSSSNEMLNDTIKEAKWVLSMSYDDKNKIKACKTLEDCDIKLKSMEYNPKKHADKRVEDSSNKRNEDHEGCVYIFECQKWLAKDEGDKQIERILKPTSIVKQK